MFAYDICADTWSPMPPLPLATTWFHENWCVTWSPPAVIGGQVLIRGSLWPKVVAPTEQQAAPHEYLLLLSADQSKWLRLRGGDAPETMLVAQPVVLSPLEGA